MSVLWEQFSGDTSRFAVKLAFHSDPDDGRGIESDVALSWGALQVWVDGINICAHVDQGETLQAVHWYLLPLLEWLVESWDPLLHEERLPFVGKGFETAADAAEGSSLSMLTRPGDPRALEADERRYQWESRHNLRAARDGGLLPDLSIRRFRDRVELSWANRPLAGATEVDFVSPAGRSYQDPQLVGSALFAVAAEAAQWLRKEASESARISRLADELEALGASEHAEERTAWLAGLGSTREQVIAGWRSLRDGLMDSLKPKSEAFRATFFSHADTSSIVMGGSCEAALLFGSFSPSIANEDALVLGKLLLSQYDKSAPDNLVEYGGYESPDPTLSAWAHGYELALSLLDDFEDEFVRDGLVDVEAFLVNREIHIAYLDLSDRLTRAVSFASSTHRSTIAINKTYRYSDSDRVRRFTLAHELCHLLYDRDHGVRLAVASGSWAPRVIEQRANAFAAMLLMPPDLLARAIDGSSYELRDIEGVRNVAEALQVGVSAVVEHSYNLGFIDEADREDLRLAARVE